MSVTCYCSVSSVYRLLKVSYRRLSSCTGVVAPRYVESGSIADAVAAGIDRNCEFVCFLYHHMRATCCRATKNGCPVVLYRAR